MPQTFKHFKVAGAHSYSFTDPVTDAITTYTGEQIKDFIRHDRDLRKGNVRPTDPSPCGYADFAERFNLEDGVHTKFCFFNSDGALTVAGPQLGYRAVIPDGGYETDTPVPRRAPAAPGITTTTTTSVSAPASPSSDVLTPQRRELISEILWDQAENNIRQKKRRDAHIAARKALKAQKAKERKETRAERIRNTDAPTGTSPFAAASSSSSSSINLDDMDEDTPVKKTA
ncbi:hypothetical protein ONZ45_g15536 [Pleurotus djamor]|nr:hypothetical protein ONZ45_g15536 [Pleurotus djamor]